MAGENDTVLVTGASGFLARHLIAQLIESGHSVRGTIRNSDSAPALQQSLEGLVEDADRISEQFSWVQADLMDDAGWADAISGVQAVFHTAGPAVRAEPRNPAEVIRSSVESTERVIRFMCEQGVKRLILTSSLESVGYGAAPRDGRESYGPEDWTQLIGPVRKSSRCVASTLAERSAWAIGGAGGIALTTIHPGPMLGPVPDANIAPGTNPLLLMLRANVPLLPRLGFNFVDVRDVAAIHVATLDDPSTVGRRIIAAGSYATLVDIADMVRRDFPAYPVPQLELPDWASRVIAFTSPIMRRVAFDLGARRNYDGGSGRALLGHNYTPLAHSVYETMESFIDTGLLDS